MPVLVLGLVLAGCNGQARSRYPTTDQTLGLERVVLYRNGIGYFQRSGEVDGDVLTIKVRKDQVNDLLKSLTIIDRQSGRAVSVSMPLDPQTWANAALATLKPGHGSLAQVLDTLRGVYVDLATTEGAKSGRIAMVERIVEEPDPTLSSRGSRGGPAELGKDWKITLMEGQSFDVVRLSKVTGFELRDGDLAMQFHRTLDAAAGEGMFQQVEVAIRLDGASSHDLVVSYVVSAPMWKPTYRMVLPEEGKGEGLLQGWAVVDNISGEDWGSVALALTSGEPTAFRYDLHTPRNVFRTDLTEAGVRKHAEVAVGETSYGEVADDEEPAAEETAAAESRSEVKSAKIRMGGTARPARPASRSARLQEKAKDRAASGRYYDYGPPADAPAEAPPPPPAVDLRSLQRSTRAQARATQVSGLTRFDIKDRVTLPDGSSTMVALINETVQAEEAFMFKPGGGGLGFEHNPYRVVRFRNTTPFVLEPGPIAIYSGGSFVGEGLSDTISTATSATIPFAIEQGIMVTSATKSVPEQMRLLRIVRGAIFVESFQRKKTIWTVRAQTMDQGFTVLIRHERAGTRYELTERPEGTEDLLGAYLVPLKVPAGKREASLEIVEQTPTERQIHIRDEPAVKLLQRLTAVGNLQLADKQKVEQILRVRQELGRVRTEINGLHRQREALDHRAQQLRYSLDRIEKNKSADAAKRRAEWEQSLDDFIKKGQKVDLQIADLELEQTALEKQLDDLVFDLNIEVAKPTKVGG